MTARARILLLIALLALTGLVAFHFLRDQPIVATTLFQQNAGPPAEDKSHLLRAQFGPKIIETIESYIQDVQLTLSENTLQNAIRLDHQEGRPAILNENHSEAYQIYAKVLAISYYHANTMGIGISLGQLATILSASGKPEEALRTEMLAYHVAKTLNDPQESGVYEVRIAKAMQPFNRKAAIKWRLKAVKSLKNSQYREDYIALLVSLADDYRYVGSAEKANEIKSKIYQESLKHQFNKNTEWVKWSAIDAHLDQLYLKDDCDEVIRIVNEHIPNYNQSATAASYYLSFSVLRALCNQKLGNIEESKSELLGTYVVYDRVRERYGDDEIRAKKDKANDYIINVVVSGLIESHDYITALSLLETNKARTLSEILGDDSHRQGYQELSSLITEQEREIEQLFVDSYDALLRDDSHEEIIAKFHELSSRHAKQRVELKLKMGAPKTINSDIMTAAKIAELQQALPRDSVVISYFFGNDDVSAIVINRQLVDWVNLGVSSDKLKRKIRELQIALQNPETDFYLEPATELHAYLIEPISEYLTGINSIIYSPDDLLAVLPLGALFDGREFLAQKFNLVRFPSLRYFDPMRHLARVKSTKGTSCVDPAIEGARLPHQRDTSSFLKRLHGDNLTELVGPECNVANLSQSLNAATPGSFLHIGAHGIFYPTDPMRSGIHLSGANGESEYLDALKMATLEMRNLALVTLSSCETGLVDLGTPRDVFGITRALYFGGANNIVSPLWAVDAEATAKFMQDFYQHYSSGGDPATALRQAKARLIASGKYSHPYYWGAFTHVGGPV